MTAGISVLRVDDHAIARQGYRRGESYASATEQPGRSELDALTVREFEALRLLLQDETVRSIGATLGARNGLQRSHLAQYHGLRP